MTNWIGLDYGKRYIGVAIGSSITQHASALQCVSARKGVPNWSNIDKLVSEWEPTGFILGYPLNMDGTQQTLSKHVLLFQKNLIQRYQKPCILVDERLSSLQAHTMLPKYTNKETLDAQSAQVILQHWFDEGMPDT